MRLVLGTYSSLDDYDADCEYAVVDLTAEMATRILKQMDLAAGLHGANVTLHEMYYWDDSVEFFAAPKDPSWEQWLPEDCESMVVLPDDVRIPHMCFQSTEYNRRVINTASERVEVHWQGSPKHVFITITTASLSRLFVEEAVRQSQAALRSECKGGH